MNRAGESKEMNNVKDANVLYFETEDQALIGKKHADKFKTQKLVNEEGSSLIADQNALQEDNMQMIQVTGQLNNHLVEDDSKQINQDSQQE